MGFIDRRGAKGAYRYRARYRAPDGRERSRTFTRKLDAERFLIAMESAKDRGVWVDPALGRTIVEAWLGEWLDGVRPTLKPKTIDSYESLIRSRIVPALGRLPLARVRPSDVQAWINAMTAGGLSASRVRQAHVVLSQAFDVAVRDGYMATNPSAKARLPRLVRKEAAFLVPEDVERVARAAGDHGLLVRVMGVLGLRWGEAVALRRRHVDLLRRRLLVEESLAEISGRLVWGTPKSHQRRTIPIAPVAVELEEHLAGRVGPDPDALLFTTKDDGLPLRVSNWRRDVWKKALREVGLPGVPIHSLRHSAAAALHAADASGKAVQTVMGHASYSFTQTVYGHIFEEGIDDLGARLEALRAKAIRRVDGTISGPRAASSRPGTDEEGRGSVAGGGEKGG